MANKKKPNSASIQANKLIAELPEKREKIKAQVQFRTEILESQKRVNYQNEFDRLRPIPLLRVFPTKSFDSRFGGLRVCRPSNLRVSSGVKLQRAINSNS